MDAENFYDEFKSALHFFGIPWAEKSRMKVKFKKKRVVFSYGNLKIEVPEKESK